jgi:flagellar biosynthesis/type III secretory pathway protein FliH
MSEDKFRRFENEKIESAVHDFQVADPNIQKGFTVKNFDLPRIRHAGEGDYEFTREKFGINAAHDPKAVQMPPKDSRFKINMVSRKSLSIEEEERRYIEVRVQEELKSVTDQARAKAEKEGFEQGVQKGYDACHKKFQEEGSERLIRFDKVLDAIENATIQIFKTNEDFLIELIYRISKMLILKELSVDRQYVVRLVSEVIQKVALHENIRIRINQSDMESVKYIKEGLEKTLGKLKNVNIETSEEVKMGGVLVDTEWSAIDATLERQIQGVYQSLLIEQKSGKAIDALVNPPASNNE